MSRVCWSRISSLPVVLLLVAVGACTSSGGGTRPVTGDQRPPAAPAVSAVKSTPVGAATIGPVVEAAVTVEIAQMRFQPAEVWVNAGEAVAWNFNDSGTSHTVTAFDRSFDSGVMSSGQFAVRFDTPGTYCYQCLTHPGINLCAQGARAEHGLLLLAANPLKAGLQILKGGGGHMQGKVVVEP